MVDNILMNSFSFGIHAYTQGGNINNLYIEGNTSVNHGVIAGEAKANILIGGGTVAQNPTLLNNYSYYSPAVGGRAADLNYGSGCNGPTINNNYLIGSGSLWLKCTNILALTGNTFYGSIIGFSSTQYPSNTYQLTRPSGIKVFVRPNKYEQGRANVTIYNWDGANTINVNLSTTGLLSGQNYEIRDAQNYFGAPVAQGTYNPTSPTVALPMAGLTAATPIGMAAQAHTSSEFGAFVVLPRR